MQNYYSRINDLRKELTSEIVERLKALSLKFIIIPDQEEYEDGTWVMWVDDDGYGYDGRVVKISLEGADRFSVDVEDNNGTSTTLYSGVDVGCSHVEWLESMLSMLREFVDGDNWDYCSKTGQVTCKEE